MEIDLKKLLLIPLLLVSACAWTEDTVQIPRPGITVAAVPAAADVAVSVQAIDARSEREVSHKKNGYGMRAANILASNNFQRDMEASLRDLLDQQGFRTGGDAVVSVTLSRFYSTFDLSFFSATATAQAIASVNVTDRNGRTIYGRVYTAGYQEPNLSMMGGANAALALTGVYRELVQQIASDAELTRILLEAGRPALGARPRIGS